MEFKESNRFTTEGKPKTVWVDIDETICTYGEIRRYDLAIPIKENIDKINKLFNEGWIVVYWTARGSISGIDYKEFTMEQLTGWGCLFHDLICGNQKGHFDLLIDDKSKRIEEL
jgi:dTDP-glucose 4,6-dehydratase